MGLNQITAYYLDETLEFLLDTFCDYFLDKGIVSVEYTDTPNKNKSPSAPFITEEMKDRKYCLVIGKPFIISKRIICTSHNKNPIEEEYYTRTLNQS